MTKLQWNKKFLKFFPTAPILSHETRQIINHYGFFAKKHPLPRVLFYHAFPESIFFALPRKIKKAR